MRSIAECEYLLLQHARQRHRDGQSTHVFAHEVVLCEDHQSCMVYFYFGLPGYDPGETDVGDIDCKYYDLNAPIRDFDSRAAAALFAPLVAAINDKTAFRVS